MREYDLATVCKWIGNSPEVAARHYATSVDLDADFQRAARGDEAQRNAQEAGSAKPRQDETAPHMAPDENGPDGTADTVCRVESDQGGREEWACLDSNQGPHPYQGCALTS